MSNRKSTTVLLNILSVLALIGVLCVGAGFLAVFTNPMLNPIARLRPVEIPTVPPTATPSSTPRQLPPTFTPPPTNTPAPTSTLRPTSTPIPTNTPFSIVTPPTPEEGASPVPEFAYVVQPGNPTAIQNVTHPELGCGWTGVGGQAKDLSDAPVIGLVVQLGGTLEGVEIAMTSLTGVASSFGYGAAGYEFELPVDGPIASKGTLYVQLLDQSGQPVSDKIFFDTYDSCDQNLILINFTQIR